MIFPIFPLNGAILFPNTNLPLNIFEKRYIQLIEDCMKEKRIFGLAFELSLSVHIWKNLNGSIFTKGTTET